MADVQVNRRSALKLVLVDQYREATKQLQLELELERKNRREAKEKAKAKEEQGQQAESGHTGVPLEAAALIAKRARLSIAIADLEADVSFDGWKP